MLLESFEGDLDGDVFIGFQPALLDVHSKFSGEFLASFKSEVNWNGTCILDFEFTLDGLIQEDSCEFQRRSF